MITPSVVTPMIASRETSTMPCKLDSSCLTPDSCSRVPFQLFQTTTLTINWATDRMMTNCVRFDPRKLGRMKQSPMALGITNVGRGHNLWLAREMKEFRSKNIPPRGTWIRMDLKWETGDSPTRGL